MSKGPCSNSKESGALYFRCDGQYADTLSKVEDFYDRNAEGYEHITRVSLESNAWLKDIILQMFPGHHHMKVLDVGTAAGFVAITMSQMGHDVVGIDISPEMIAEAKSLSE